MIVVKRISPAFAVVFFLLAFGDTSSATSILRLALLPEAVVTGPAISLCDLLPLDAPALLREKARKIALGASPQLGSTRILERDFIERAIGANRQVLPSVAVPERVVVSRNMRLIDLQEVFRAVRDSLKETKSAAADSLCPEDLILEVQIFVGPGDPGLKVVDVTPAPALPGAVFKISAINEPSVLPFYVAGRFAGGATSVPHTAAESNLTHPRGTSSIARAYARSPREFLIAAGRRATLNLHTDTLQMVLDVLCLERGAIGQQVRVRLESGKVLTATVDGLAHLSGRL